MTHLYSAKDALEAHDVRLFLESRGIRALVVGDNSPFEAGFSFTPGSGPSVVVAPSDLEQAGSVLKEYLAQAGTTTDKSLWKCVSCGETVEDQFDVCWNCETPRGDAPADLPDNMPVSEKRPPISQSTAFDPSAVVQLSASRIWTEILTVTIVGLVASLGPFVARAASVAQTAWIVPVISLWEIAINIAVFLLIASYVKRDGGGWHSIGVKRPAAIFDTAAGILLVLILITILMVVSGIAADLFDRSQVSAFVRGKPRFLKPLSDYERVLVLISMLLSSVTEEIAMRGFVLTRLSQATKSWPGAVVLGSIFSLNYHIAFGAGPAITSLLICLFLAAAFWFGRRIWPLVIAHCIGGAIAASQLM